MWFIDGFGLGDDDPSRNPLAAECAPAISRLLGGDPFIFTGLRRSGWTTVAAVDATLGVPGLPQSATGQTTLLTGINAARMVGRHINGYPTPTLVNYLRSGHNLFSRLVAKGLRPAFLNAYTDQYLLRLYDYKREQGWPASGAQAVTARRVASARETTGPSLPRRFRPSASTVAVDAAGLPLRDMRDLRAGVALFHDITGESLTPFGEPALTVRQAVRTALAVWQSHDFVFYETFLTDLLGHRQDMDSARRFLRLLDAFLAGLLQGMDPEHDLLILTSDHGNFEDMSVKTHTVNPVPVAAYGRSAHQVASSIRSLTDVVPALMQLWPSS